MTRDKTSLTTEKDLGEYFGGLVTQALQSQKAQTLPVVKQYIISLLLDYSRTENLYPKDQEEALAFRWLHALTAEFGERVKSLKQMGDFTLFVAGFFPDSLSRKLIDVDYYMALGGKAYGCLSQIFTHYHPMKTDELFGDLSHRFSLFVDVLSEVSERSSISTDTGLLRLYERWIRTRSERLARMLSDRGVIPMESLHKDFIQ
ncbi:MAG: hypothetical protein HY538_07145 [Deltaproteobacteria bacterium]|nr:hypothetical protein [Deltaproteobacteria bacterium]